MRPKQSIFTRLRRQASAGAALVFLLAGPVLTLSAQAQTANTTSFYYKRDAGGFQDLSQLKFYGDAAGSTGTNALRAQVTDPTLRAQIPATVTSLQVTPAAVNSVQSWRGGVYYKQPVDLSKGFRTKFFVNSTTGKLSLVLRNVNDTHPLNSSATGNAYGYTGMTNSVAISLDPPGGQGRLYVPDSNGVLGYTGGFSAGNLPRTNTNGLLGTAIVQYIPRSQVLELYYEDMFSGQRTRVFQATNIDLDKLGVLTGGKALVGFVATNGPTRTNGPSFSPVTLQSWEFGTDLSMQGITSTSYSDRLVFNTAAPNSVWNPLQNTGVVFENVYSASGGDTIDSSSHTGPFSAGFTGDWNGNVGLHFKGTAQKGSVDIRYPLFLDLQFPPQASLSNGSQFTIQAAYEPDALAGFATTSPVYKFQASTWFGFNFDSRLSMDLGFTKFGLDLPGIHANMPETTFFDFDTSLQAFGTSGGGSIQDGHYFPLGASSARGFFNGVATGATTYVNPLNYIQVQTTTPNLATSGYVDIFNDSKPTLLTGSAASDFVGLRADFTGALFGMLGMEKAVNDDESVNLGAGNKYSFGWNLADLYGTLQTTVDMTHTFQPQPYLVLCLDDLDPATGNVLNPLATRYVKMALDPDGKPTNSPSITMSANPVRVTPIVYLSNPKNTGRWNANDPSLPDTTAAFNAFNTSAGLNLNGNVQFKPVEIYAKASGIPDIHVKPAVYTLFNQSGPLASNTSGLFEIPGFQPMLGKPYYFYPAEASAPVVDAATPSSIVMPSTSTGLTYVQLTTKMAGTHVSILFDGHPLTGEVDIKDDIIHFGIPNSLLAARGVHQLALVSNPNTIYARTSNVVTFEVSAPVPVGFGVTPNVVSLYQTPVAGNNPSSAPILQTDADGLEYFTLSVNGTGFAGDVMNADGSVVLPHSVIEWNGIALPTTLQASKTLVARASRALIASAGTATITVRTSGAGGGQSAGMLLQVNNPRPTVTSVSPTLIRGNVQTDLILKGQDFVKGAQVTLNWWDGQASRTLALPTIFASPGELVVNIAANSLATNTYSLFVANPAPRGGPALATYILNVDADTPVTTAQISGTTTDGHTFQGPVTISLSATDVGSSGIDKTYLETDNLAVDGDGAPVGVTGAVTLTQPGTYTLRYYSVDKVGNAETPRETTITILAP